MFLTSSDSHAIKEVTLFYSVLSCILLPIFCAVLYLSDGYLHFGKSYFLPVLSLLLVIEYVKWRFHYLIYERDFKTTTTRKGSTTYFLFKRFFDVNEYTKTFVTVTLGCVIFFIVAIFFGASLTEKYEETLMFSVLMSILTLFPICLHLGRPFLKMILLRQLANCNMFQWLLYQNFQMTLLGAWIGAFAIPLDWDRPWQVWPIPCSFGALLGYTLSHYITLVKYFVFGSYSVFFKKKI